MHHFDVLSNPANPAKNVCQFLTFLIGDEEYGVEILKVQEVKGYSGVTPVPNVPAHVMGVMNLRGTIIPVIDPRCTFSLPPGAYARTNVVVVITVGAKVMGLVVDAVSDVVTFAPDEIQDAPQFGEQPGCRCIERLAKVGDKVVLLLDIERMLGVAQPALQAS